MCKVLDNSGNGAFFPGGASHPNSKLSALFLALGQNVDLSFPPRKRIRDTSPFESFEQKQQPSIEVLLDECLFEIFKRLPSGRERSACACVSKRWLTLLSSIRRDETFASKPNLPSKAEEGSTQNIQVKPLKGSTQNIQVKPLNIYNIEGEGYLSRSLHGKKATDVRLAAIAIGTASRGGLAKLSIRGNNPYRGVTDAGLKAIARGSPFLRDLSLWNESSVGDEGLSEIAHGCHLLEKLDLCQCPEITDNSLLDIAKNCPNLTSLTIDSCSDIGNESLQTVGRYCPNLKLVAIKICSLIGDQGIAGLFSSAGHFLTKVMLQALNISDISLAVIGHYGIALTNLALRGLQSVNERVFWVMGSGKGLQKLKFLIINACNGVSDVGLEALCKGCPNLKRLCLKKIVALLDNELVAFAKASVSLEKLQLEECHRITQAGFFGILFNCGKKLKALSLVNCFGVNDSTYAYPLIAPCNSLQSLAIRNCPRVGNATVAVVGRLCPELTHLELRGLRGITDEGLVPLVQSCVASLVEVNLRGCVNVTDKSVSAIAKLHGRTLESLIIDGCRHVTDATLVEISDSCWFLTELDVSKCGITDSGIATLASAAPLCLKVLSLSGCPLVSDKSLPFLHELGQNLYGLNIKHCRGISSSTVDVLEQIENCDILS